MLRAIIISPSAELSSRLEEVANYTGALEITRSVNQYLDQEDLDRLLLAHVPDVIFLSVEDLGRALTTVTQVGITMRGVQIVGIDRESGPQVLLDLMRAGIREFIPHPFEENGFLEMAGRLEQAAQKNPVLLEATDTVLSFLPAKAGCGASTIALNTALALAKHGDVSTLLMDLDLNSGLLGFMLKLDSQMTIYDAAENSERLDETLWPQLISRIGKMDVIPSGRLDPRTRIEPAQFRQLLHFARRFYRAICLDLSGNMEKYSLELMQESKRIFVVCTPEIPAVHLARKKVQLLQNMDLGDRIFVLLNRAQRNAPIGAAQIEQLLEIPVFQQFPNDYDGVHAALTQGRETAPDSELGKEFLKLANTILDREDANKPAKAKKKGLLSMLGIPKLSGAIAKN